MIVLDSSALVAILSDEDDAPQLTRALARSARCSIATPTVVEASIVLLARFGAIGRERLAALLASAGARSVAFDDRLAEIAITAHLRYGRGSGHPARLNFGDCFSYALARSLDVPLLYKGDDFVHTDIRSAIQP